MVKISILSYRGNSNSRFYPHTGYLGLTPVKVEGVIRTSVEEDKRPVQASSVQVSVACIECRLGRVGVVHQNVLADYSQTLWSKPPSEEYAELGDSDLPFRIVIPAKTQGFSYTNFQDYRVYWRIEAVIHHAPIFGVGNRKLKTYEIPLVRYDTNVPHREFIPSPTRELVTTKPRAPVVQYQLSQPTTPVGPLDIVTISLMLRPLDPSVVIRSASMVVERRIELAETAQMPPVGRTSGCHTPVTAPPPSDGGDSSGSTIRGLRQGIQGTSLGTGAASTSTAHLLGYSTTDMSQSSASLASSYATELPSEHRPLLMPIQTDLPSKTVSLTVAHVDSSGAFQKDATGSYAKSLTLQWPANKSNSHWAMGETMQTELINVRFFTHVKIIVSSPSTGTETVELEERELFLIATNESERKLAVTKYTDARARSKSKSPRRSKQPPSPRANSTEVQQPPPDPVPSLPPPASPTDNRDFVVARDSSPSGKTSKSSTRRPHTSAGPRDKSSSRPHSHHHDTFSSRDRDRFTRRDDENQTPPLPNLRPLRRPETAMPSSVVSASSPKPSAMSSKEVSPASTYPYPPAHARRSSRETVHHVVSPPNAGFASDPGTVRAWEDELARIERTSRRKSVNLGFNLKRLRPRSLRPKTPSSSVTSESS